MANNFSEKSDSELVNLVKKEANSFSFIIERYEKKLFWYIKRISNFSDDEIEDILQNTFIKVFKNINNYDSDLKFSSWLYRICRNEVIDVYRKNKKQQIFNEKSDWDIKENILNNFIDEFDIKNKVDNDLLKKNLYKVLNKMDIKYKEVLIYKYFEEKSYDEISDIIKKPVNSVGTLISRAKKKFKKELEKENIKI